MASYRVPLAGGYYFKPELVDTKPKEREMNPRPTVERKLKEHVMSVATLSRLMADCLPEQIEDERDMAILIRKLWPALVCEQEVEQ